MFRIVLSRHRELARHRTQATVSGGGEWDPHSRGRESESSVLPHRAPENTEPGERALWHVDGSGDAHRRRVGGSAQQRTRRLHVRALTLHSATPRLEGQRHGPQGAESQ
jgi:hypothetical protein